MSTPCLIEVMLHCHAAVERHPRAEAPAVIAALRWLQDMHLIHWDSGSGWYESTPRGKAWVEMLCATPLPRLAWVDANGAVVKVAEGD